MKICVTPLDHFIAAGGDPLPKCPECGEVLIKAIDQIAVDYFCSECDYRGNGDGQ